MSFFSKKTLRSGLLAMLGLAAIPLTAAEKAVVLRKYDFNKGTLGWVTPGYWTGKSVHNRANGTMVMTPGSRNGSPLNGRCYTQSGLTDVRGQKLELSCRVRGTGKVKLGAYFSVLNSKTSKWVYGEPLTLTSDWQVLTFPMDFSKKGIITVWPIIDIISDGQVEFDDMVIKGYADNETTSIKGESVIRRHVEGTPFPAVKFQTSEPNQEFAVFAGSAAAVEAPVMLKSDSNGLLTVPGDMIKLRSDKQALVTVARNGVNCRTAIELIAPEQYEKLDSAASKVKFSAQTDIAVLADSLWDFDRGWNAADELAFWLNKHNSNLVKLHNFAVRGNSIVTDEVRFYQQVSAFNWNANKAMFNTDLAPKILLIQLGHNDTRSYSGENFAKPWVSTAEQLGSFRRMITNLRRMWPACRIILVTPVANDTDYNAKKSAAEVRRGQRSWRFGDPDKVQTYIANLHKIAQEFNLEVCDVYTPMSKIADRKKYFRADGVHLVRGGYWYLAEQIMKYLGEHPQAPAVKALAPEEPYNSKFVFKNTVLPAAGMTSPAMLASENSKRTILGFGNLKKLADGSVRLDGNTGGLALDDSVKLDLNKGVTLSMTVKNNALPHPQHKAMFGSYFFKANTFLFCRHNRKLYFNCFIGGRWIDGLNTGDIFEEEFGSESYHHIAATIKRHKVQSQGEDWLEVKLYMDGNPVGQKRFMNVELARTHFPLEIASASYLGTVWRSKADIAQIEIMDKVLTESEIEELFLQQPLVKKKLTGVLTPEAEQLLAALNAAAPERIAALRNLALSGIETVLLKKYISSQDQYFTGLRSSNSVLTIFTGSGKVRIISWFDLKNQREMLSANSPMFSVKVTQGARNLVLSPLSDQVISNFVSQPAKQGNAWKFVIKSDLGNNAFAQTAYTFEADRLEFQVTADVQNSSMLLREITQPDLTLNVLKAPKDTLLVPIMSGVEYPSAAANGANYTDVYPHGTASMQLGAYYDDCSGIYWTILDPKASYKFLDYQVGRKRAAVKIGFPVPGPIKNPQKVFTAAGTAVLELFSGNWYDAGLLYRRDLSRMQALWWRKTLPNTDTPEWFRNNALYLRRLVSAGDDVPIMKQLRDYLECTFVIGWGHAQSANYYSPLLRVSPDAYIWMQDVHKLGLKTIPYTDPRLWQKNDRRDEDVLFSKVAYKNCAVEGGKVLTERYGKEICGVVCPGSAIIRDYMKKYLIYLTDLGYDGIYADQIGAARPNLCENPSHGHTARDGSMHYAEGWRKLFMDIRQHWLNNGGGKISATEDNAEQCVGMFDAMLPWRWMYENQVPLYPMIYAGRTQFIGREPDCEDPRAIYPKAASQIVNSEQIGFLEYPLLTSPLRKDYRIFLKQIIHLRFAMLDFFNSGMMARPVSFARPWKKVPLTWGVRGTGIVSTEDVVSSAWCKGDFTAIMLINHTTQQQRNKLLYKLRSNSNKVWIWSSQTAQAAECKTSADLALALDMAPRSMMLIFCAPAGADSTAMRNKIEKSFAVIRRAPQTSDPFVLDLQKMRNCDAGLASDLHQAKNIAEVAGARLNIPRNQINWIRDAIASAGTVDFGNGSGKMLAAAFAAPPRCGMGVVSFYIDDMQENNKFAEFSFDGRSFNTRDWNTFAIRQTPLLRKVTGKHRVFIKLEGSSFCNFQSWQVK